MSNIYFFDNNFIDPDVVNAATTSSAQTAFPYSNITDFNRRSKVWRSAGYWVITAANNGIVIYDTAATPLTGNVTVGTYTTATLLVALKAKLEAISASTYTVTVSSTTGKINIASNGAGGGGIFSLITTNASFTMASVLGFDTATDLTGALTYSADYLRIATEEFIQWDLGLSSNPHAIAIIGPRNAPLKLSPGSTLTLQGSQTNSWSTIEFSQVLTYNDSTIAYFVSTGVHTEQLRYWRLLISDLSNSYGYVEIGSIFLGEAFSTSQGRAQFPLNYDLVDRSNVIFSEGGQTFSDKKEQTTEFSSNWIGLSVADVEGLVDLFARYGTHKPFFILLDPDAVFSSVYNKNLRYVKFLSEPQFNLLSPGNFSASINFREEL